MIHGGIDGFRFDLATALGRGPHGFDPNAPFFQALDGRPRSAPRAPHRRALGRRPRRLPARGLRPRLRRMERPLPRRRAPLLARRPGMRGEIATRIAGSRDVFARAAAPSKSVNFIVAHDGFTLADLVSYEKKHNEANGERNRDGTDANFSWNNGVEGPSDDPAVVAARARDQRNLLTLLFVSRGTPMLAMGSELGFSQGGNNNAYAQDNATTAIRWSEADASLIAFVQRLAQARRAHPALSRDAFLTGEKFDASGLPDVEWRDAEGPMTQSAWNDPAGPVLVAVFAAPHDGGVDRVAVAMNRSSEEAELSLPAPRPGMAWRVLVDSHDPDAPERPLAHRGPPAPSRPLLSHPRRKPVLARRPSRRAADSPHGRGAGERRRNRRRMVGRRRQAHHRLAGNQDRAPDRARARGGQRGAGARQPGPASSTRRGGGASPIRSFCAPTSRCRRRCATRRKAARSGSNARTGRIFERRVEAGEGARSDLPDGRSVEERTIALPDLPLGRHRLIVDGVACAAHGRAAGVLLARGRAAQALRDHGAAVRAAPRRRPGDRRLLDAGARGRGGRRRRRGLFRREPDAYAVPARPGAGEPLPSVRPALSRSDADRRPRRRAAARRGARGGARRSRPADRGGRGDEARRLSGGMGGQARRAERAPCGLRAAPAWRGRRIRSSPSTAPSSRPAAKR